MPIEQDMVTISDPGQHDRCQGITRFGQCDFVSLENKRFCKIHIGCTNRHEEKKNIGNLRIARYRARLEELVDSPDAKSLREELGLLRILLEEELNACHDATALMIKSNKISNLIMQIEKIVASVHKLEKSTGQLLDKSAAIQLAAQFVDIINQEITDHDVINRISNKLIESIQTIQPKDVE